MALAAVLGFSVVARTAIVRRSVRLCALAIAVLGLPVFHAAADETWIAKTSVNREPNGVGSNICSSR